MTHLEICKKLCKSLGERDIYGISACLADNVVVEHPAVPDVIITSKQQFLGVLDEFFKWATEGRVDVLRTAEDGDAIWMERIDRWKIENTWTEVPIAAVFDLEASLITRWKEYLDYGYMSQFKTRPADALHQKVGKRYTTQ